MYIIKIINELGSCGNFPVQTEKAAMHFPNYIKWDELEMLINDTDC